VRVLFHPEFPQDQRRIQADYAEISEGLAIRFRQEIDDAIEAIKASPDGAGHFLNAGFVIRREYRRRNLRVFPFFILYGLPEGSLIFASIIPIRSDPLHWLPRFRNR